MYNHLFQRANVKCLAVQQLFYNGIFVLGRLLSLKNASFYSSRLFDISKKKGGNNFPFKILIFSCAGKRFDLLSSFLSFLFVCLGRKNVIYLVTELMSAN